MTQTFYTENQLPQKGQEEEYKQVVVRIAGSQNRLPDNSFSPCKLQEGVGRELISM